MHRMRLVVVGALSLALIALEMAWTRVFSAEFYYTFAFLTLSLAVLALGVGALVVRLAPPLARPERLGLYLWLAGAAALVGPPVVLRLGLDFAALITGLAGVARFLAAVALLGAPFMLGGMALALLFRSGCRDMPRLYMADLVGAGAGVIVAVVVMNFAGTPAATFLAAAPMALGGLLVGRGLARLPAFAVLVASVALAAGGTSLLTPPRQERAPVTYSHWDAMAKIKVYDSGGPYRAINIDNMANTTVVGFDGDWKAFEDPAQRFGVDVRSLIASFPSCSFVSLGAGGGQDVLQALGYGAAEVHAVEVNGHINRMMLDPDLPGYSEPTRPEPKAGEEATERVEVPQWVHERRSLAELSGLIYRDPRVRVVTEDARAYIGRHRDRFDIIYSLSSNTWAALASGSFALAENYLFTREAFGDYWRALSPGGYLVMEHQFYMPRLVASALDALREEGVEEPERHVAVYDLPRMRRNVLLLSRRPLTDEILSTALGPLSPEAFEDIHLLWPAAAGAEGNLIERVVRDGWRTAQAEAKIDVSPTSDDRPFVGQMGLWRNLELKPSKRLAMLEVDGFPLSKAIIVVIIATVLGLLVPANLLPYLRRGEKLPAVPWLYFFAIGAAFMALEVVLIQHFTLFVGPSVYAIATILLTLLVASGIGARLSERVPDWAPFVAIAVWVALDVLVLRRLFAPLGFLPLGGRMAVTALLVAPLGFFMGMPFPKATLRVGELVDWGFAVNGAASVLGGSGVLLVAFSFGISTALGVAGLLYLAAGALLAARSRWSIVRPEATAQERAA